MNFLKIFQIGCSCLLLNSAIDASNCNECLPCLPVCSPSPDNANQDNFGTASFGGGPDVWYTIETNAYPDVALLSQNRNKGLSEGGVYLSPTGFTIGEAGNYWVTLTATLQNPTADSTLLTVMLLGIDDVFDPASVSPLGNLVTLESGKITQVQAMGTLKNVASGTRLSIVATNAGSSPTTPITVVSWSISVSKMP